MGRGGGTQPLRGGLAWWGGVPLGITAGGGELIGNDGAACLIWWWPEEAFLLIALTF